MRHVPVIAVSLWLGMMGFFAFVVAPAAFGTLERESAGRLVTAVFPRYYGMGVALGLLALAALIWRGGGGRGVDWVPLVLVALMMVLTVYAMAVLAPQAEAAWAAVRAARSEGVPTAEALRFARLHRLSGILNLVVMGAGVVLVALEAVRGRGGS
jgi:fatty acid desaturase